jgi:hypothetical protein
MNIINLIKEEYNNIKCPEIELNQDIINFVSKFTSSEELLRSGGIDIELLDYLTFGFNEDSIKILDPNILKIEWKADIENVKYEMKNSGLSSKDWARKVNLSEPIDVDYKIINDKIGFYIQDGHHRYTAAKILNKPLNVNLQIKINPIKKLAPDIGYDDFHRCIFNQIKNKNNMNLNEGLIYTKYNIKYDINYILDIGKKFYPKLKLIDDRFYENYPKNKGSHSIGGFINILLSEYLKYIYENLKGIVKNIILSKTTNSIYFKIGDINFRISDHKNSKFEGRDINYNLYTDINDLINQIKNNMNLNEENESNTFKFYHGGNLDNLDSDYVFKTKKWNLVLDYI